MPESVRKAMTFHLASRVEDVLEIALIEAKPQIEAA